MDKFSKQDTSVVKGIAILMLICHHLFMGVLPAPIDWMNNPLWVVVATLSKVCVAIFVVLSGYGLNESHKKWEGSDFAFTKKHLLKLMKQYWFIFIIFVPLGKVCGINPFDVYGRSLTGLKYFVIDFFGMKALFNTPTMNQTWWYMEACIVLYILYPILRRLMKKIPVIIFAVTLVPVVKLGLFNDGSIDGCREIYWIFPFVTGIFLSDKDLLNKMSKVISSHYTAGCIIAVVCALVMTAVRSYFGIIADTLYALAIIAASKAILSRIKYVNSLLGYLGGHSANIFMMHSFLYCYYVPIKQIYMVFASRTINFVLLTVSCVAVSDYIEILKGRLSKIFTRKQQTPQINTQKKKEAVMQ